MGRGVGFWVSGPTFLESAVQKSCPYQISDPTNHFLFLAVCLSALVKRERGDYYWNLGPTFLESTVQKTCPYQISDPTDQFEIFADVSVSYKKNAAPGSMGNTSTTTQPPPYIMVDTPPPVVNSLFSHY